MSYSSGSGDGQDDARQAASLQRVTAGGIPLSAEQRLAELAREDTPFTSTLSVSEFALMNELGPQSLGQVMGACVHQVGWQYLPSEARYGRTMATELAGVEQAWNDARELAFRRLRREAELLGADAVIGVRLRQGGFDWARNTIDYVVTGTAVKLPGRRDTRRGWHPRQSGPRLSDLSVQEYWKLHQCGWEPSGLCASTAVWFVTLSTGTKWNQFITTNRNQELHDYSQCFTRARLAAVRSLRDQASRQGGSGVVGVTLDHHIHEASIQVGRYYSNQSGREEREGLAITIQAVGTAIAYTGERDTQALTMMRLGA